MGIMAACRAVFNRISSFINSSNFLQIRSPLPSCDQNTFLKTTVYEKMGIDKPPKKPLVSFFKFKKMMYDKIKEENPALTHKETLKFLSQQWKEYPAENKKILQEEFNNELVVFNNEIKQFMEKLSPEQRELLKEEKKMSKLKKNDAKEARTLRQKRKISGRPKRPLSAYSLYIKDRLITAGGSKDPNTSIKIFANDWKNLSSDVKNKYKLEYQKEKENYAVKLKAWETKMIELGNLDIIGIETLKKLNKQLKEQDKFLEDTERHEK